MARKVTVVVSQGQSAHPDKRKLEEDLVAGLLLERGLEVTVIPHLYDLPPDGTGMLCLQGITGDMIVASWLYPRAAHWTLDRHGIRGRFGASLIKSAEEEDAEEESGNGAADELPADEPVRVGPRDLPSRTIWHLDLRACRDAQPYLAEVRRIVHEASVQTVSLGGLNLVAPPREPASAGQAALSQTPRVPAAAATHSTTADATLATVQRIDEQPQRRWYPVIDFSRCTNCMECIDFCLFGVYGVDKFDTILVEQPDNCRKGCPACSRVCPENAIIFPQHKSPAIAGSPVVSSGGLKIDLSQLFGGPSAIEVAALERDEQLVAAGRDAVGLSVGIPKRQAGRPLEPKDDLDRLIDDLDALNL